MSGKHAILCCSIFRQEIEKLKVSEKYPHVQIVFFPGTCGRPPVELDKMKNILLGPMDYAAVDVLGSLCVTEPELPDYKPFHIHGMRNCFHMIANPDLVDKYVSEGRHLVTPGWLSSWRQFVNAWGFDRPTAQSYFAESAKEILMLDTGVDDAAYRNLQEFSDFVDRPYEALTVGLGFIDLFVANVVIQRQVKLFSNEHLSLLDEKQKELSYYAMAFDLLRTITKVKNEDEVVSQITDMFNMLFAPRTITYKKEEPDISPATDAVIRREKGFVLPISANGRLMGRFELDGLQFPEYIDRYLILSSGLMDVCGMALENARYYQEIKDLSEIDGLTGIANRRRFDQCIEQEWKRMARERQPLSVIMCDVDYFKLYNDTYGHQAGDDCLRKVATELSSNCKRPGDLVARYGGEEFVLVLPDTPEEGAFQLAENIRHSIEKQGIPHANSQISPWITLSLGVACCVHTSHLSAQSLLMSADQALYAAKSTGRNRTAVKQLKNDLAERF
ncbi:MAG: diguanylate cyclase [Proteobacteria bacterium]|nr:diguanylate cyclase [Pseudomonadota bacterium]